MLRRRVVEEHADLLGDPGDEGGDQQHEDDPPGPRRRACRGLRQRDRGRSRRQRGGKHGDGVNDAGTPAGIHASTRAGYGGPPRGQVQEVSLPDAQNSWSGGGSGP